MFCIVACVAALGIGQLFGAGPAIGFLIVAAIVDIVGSLE